MEALYAWIVDWLPKTVLGAYGLVEVVAFVLAVSTVPSVLLQRRGRPLAAAVWLLVLLRLPIIGVVAWWAVGRRHLIRKRRRRVAAHGVYEDRLSGVHASADGTGAMASNDARERLLYEATGVFPTRPGSRAALLVDGAEAYPALEAAIRAAKDHIHAQFYIWEPDAAGARIRDLLIEKAGEGVKVRVLYDAVGGGQVHGRFMSPLRAANAEVASFLPVRLFSRALTVNFRNHRKIVVIDGRVGFTGGQNVADEYAQHWHDLMIRVRGPVVNQLQEVFADDWFFATGRELVEPRYFDGDAALTGEAAEDGSEAICRIIASGPDQTGRNATHDAFFLSITSATRRIWVITPYFVPDAAIAMALRTAAWRGVDVRLVLPRRSDVRLAQYAGRANFESLLEAGVHIYEYVPRVLHAKVLIVDDEWSAVGSANMDTRSFRLNFEASCFMCSREMNASLAELFEQDVAQSEAVILESFRQRPRRQQLAEAAANLLSPFL